MQALTNSLWKIAATSLALIPGLYGIIFFMVQARTEALSHRISYVERELGKGERFTMHDGEIMQRQITSLIDRHESDRNLTRESHDKIRYEDATLKANQQNLIIRFSRIEEKVYALNTLRDDDRFKKSPYNLPPDDTPWWRQATWEENVRGDY